MGVAMPGHRRHKLSDNGFRYLTTFPGEHIVGDQLTRRRIRQTGEIIVRRDDPLQPSIEQMDDAVGILHGA